MYLTFKLFVSRYIGRIESGVLNSDSNILYRVDEL